MIVVSKEAADEDTLMMIALDAGAEDVSTDGDSFEITTAPEDFLTVSDALEKEGIAVEASEVTMVPDNTVSLEGDAADVMNKLTSELEELMTYRACTPTQNFRKIWNNRKHRFKPVFFAQKSGVDLGVSRFCC